MHGEMGLPKIRTEIRYAKATPEVGVDNTQLWPMDELEPGLQPDVPNQIKRKPTKGKKGKKKKT